jgi:hypothetical protein
MVVSSARARASYRSLEIWRDHEALDAHMAHPHTQQFLTRTTGLIVGTPAMAFHEVRDSRWPGATRPESGIRRLTGHAAGHRAGDSRPNLPTRRLP